MTGVSFIIRDEEVDRGLGGAAAAGRDTAPLMEAIAGHLLFSSQRRFETETGPDGKKWAPLRPRTANRRIGRGRQRGTEHILRVSARLYQSLTADAGPTEATVGTNLVYARPHQLGATIERAARRQTIRLRKVKGRTQFARKAHKRAREMEVSVKAHTITIPARPYLGFSAEDKAAIQQIVKDFTEQSVERGAR